MLLDLLYFLVFFVLLIVAFYHPKHSLTYHRIHSKDIDSVLFGELWILRKAYWPDDHKKRFISFVKESHSTWVLFRDQTDGTLRGAYAEEVVDGDLDGKPYRVVYVGNLFFYTYYRGTGLMAVAFMHSFLRAWWSSPRGWRTFSVFSCISYKSYLLASHTYPGMYPTVKNSDAVKFKYEEAVTHQVMSRLYPEYWKNGLIQIPGVKLDVAPISEDMIQTNEDIRFFVQKNPSFEEGSALPCLFEISPKSLLETVVQMVNRSLFYSFSKKSKSSSRSDHKHLKKPRPKSRDLARTWTLPQETELSRTFNLSEKSKDNVKKFVGRLKKSDTTVINTE